MLEADFPWDAVQMPLNVFDAQFDRRTATTSYSLSEDRKKDILAKAHEAAIGGKYEPFKTSAMFDSRIGRQLHGLI